MGIFSAGNKTAKPTSGATIVAAGTCIQGTFELSCNLHVDGEIKGEIQCLGTVSVGKSGHVVGNIKAAELLVCGVFDGQCEVDVLEITPTGQVEGEVKAGQLIVAKGGSFNGKCTELSPAPLPVITQLHTEPSGKAAR